MKDTFGKWSLGVCGREEREEGEKEEERRHGLVWFLKGRSREKCDENEGKRLGSVFTFLCFCFFYGWGLNLSLRARKESKRRVEEFCIKKGTVV